MDPHDNLFLPGLWDACLEAQSRAAMPPIQIYPVSTFIDEASAVTGQDRDRLQAKSGVAAIRAFEIPPGMNRVVAVAELLRRNVLVRTRLISGFISSDYVLLLATALLRRILRVEGPPLFQRRLHVEASRRANISNSEVLRWFDPKAPGRISATQRYYMEYMRSAVGLEGLDWPGRLACVGAVVPGVGNNHLRVLASRWRRRFSEGRRT